MSVQTICLTQRVARKQHFCNSCEWLSELDDFSNFSYPDKRLVVNLIRKRKGVINPGECYNIFVHKYDGEIAISKFLTEAHDLCKKYGVYRYD